MQQVTWAPMWHGSRVFGWIPRDLTWTSTNRRALHERCSGQQGVYKTMDQGDGTAWPSACICAHAQGVILAVETNEWPWSSVGEGSAARADHALWKWVACLHVFTVLIPFFFSSSSFTFVFFYSSTMLTSTLSTKTYLLNFSLQNNRTSPTGFCLNSYLFIYVEHLLPFTTPFTYVLFIVCFCRTIMLSYWFIVSILFTKFQSQPYMDWNSGCAQVGQLFLYFIV